MDDRRVISGIVHVLKSGGRWADAPPVYGPRKTLYNRFVRWAAKGVWEDIFHAWAAAPAIGPSAWAANAPTAVCATPAAIRPASSVTGCCDGEEYDDCCGGEGDGDVAIVGA